MHLTLYCIQRQFSARLSLVLPKNRERVKQGNKFFCNPLTISFHRITHLYECPVDMVDVVSMKHRAVVLLCTSSTFSFFPFFAQQSMY